MSLTKPTALQLSQRVTRLKPSATLAVTARVKELKGQGADIIGFGAGEPDFVTPRNIQEAAIASLREGCTHYMPVPGAPEARAAIARKLREENGIECGPEHVVISAGAKHSLYLTLHCLLDPGLGQQVVIPTPAWVSYRPIVEMAGGEVVEVPGSVDRDFKITPEQLADALGPRTAAIIINSPSNPCGTMYSPQELLELGRVLAEHENVTIISDEIYEKLIFGGIEHASLGADPALAERVVTINGLSKAYAMTGWRIGYACAPGHGGALASAIAKMQGQMTSCITSFCYRSIVEALTASGDEVVRMRDVFARRAALMHAAVERWPGVRCPRPMGAFYLFPDISGCFGRTSPEGRTLAAARDFAEALLEEALVAVVPGEDFGTVGANHVRLSFACSEAEIEEGCRRIEAWIGSLG